MALLTNLTVLLLLGCISHQLALISCQKSPGRRGRGSERGQHRDKPALKAARQAKSPQSLKGKTATKDGSECRWAATGQDVVVLVVTCKKGGTNFSCEYEARPSACPQYASDARLYWKQVARALKKQKNLCRDRRAMIRAGMCRRASRDAHFTLRGNREKVVTAVTAVTAPSPTLQPHLGRVTTCPSKNKKRAEEFCDESWSSFCMFFFTMVQGDDC